MAAEKLMMRLVPILAVLALGLSLAAPTLAHETKLKNQETVSLGNNRGPFELVTHRGQAVTNESFLGKFMLVYFGYTHCPDVCPLDLQTVSEAVDMLGGDGDQVRPLFVTVDPKRDTVPVLADYVKNFHPRMIGLTGSAGQIASATRVYRIRARKYFPPDAEDDQYLIGHSAAIVLVGPDGAGLSLYPQGITAEDIAKDIRRFMIVSGGKNTRKGIR
ncbi:MAG: SCO family protein [Rhodospirillaceae bacterium]|jgi:protein SCO1/2|nr:SCO family protein [Rhodospirillaceae bacterium]|tara:strand:- start:1433 stop:2083 length:651 start_codon:yes stop_codon:yes gene_type:complete